MKDGSSLHLDPLHDYVVDMPPVPLTGAGGLVINGGHNVVLIGGEIDVPEQPGNPPSFESRRGLYLKGQTGTIHVEGLWIHGSDLDEGIDLDERDGATVQIEDVRVDGVHARDELGFTDNHPDVLQTWAGPAVLRVDRLTGSSDYQGLFLAPQQLGPAPLDVDIDEVNLYRLPTPTPKCCYKLLWKSGSFPLFTHNLWVDPQPKGTLAQAITPELQAWGSVRTGVPPEGDFVPRNSVGLGYISPGYRPGDRSAPTGLAAAVD